MHAIVLVHKMQRMALLTSNSNNSSPTVKNAPAAGDTFKSQERQQPPKLPPRNTGGSAEGTGGSDEAAGEVVDGARSGDACREEQSHQGLSP